MKEDKSWHCSKTLKVDLSKPISESYVDISKEICSTSEDLLEAVSEEIISAYPGALNLAHIINLRTKFRFKKEAVEVSNIADGDWRLLMLCGMAYELMTWACSTAALATPDGPILARNMDFWPEKELARNTYNIEYYSGAEKRMSIAGWPGSLGLVTAMSSKGFAIALNAVWSTEGRRNTGYPVMLFLRKVIEDASGFDHAVEMLTKQKLMAACLLTVVGRENHERIVIERTPSKYKYRKPEGDTALVTTNNFWTDVDTGLENKNTLTETSCSRFDALVEFSKFPEAQNPSDESLLYALTDPSVIQKITAQHVIVRPRDNQMSVYTPNSLLV